MMQERKSLAIEQERMNDIVKTFKASIHSDLINVDVPVFEQGTIKAEKTDSPEVQSSVETASQILTPPKTIGDCELLYNLMGGIDE